MATKRTKKPKSNGNGKARTAYKPDAKITLLIPVAQNPKRKGSKEAKRYAKYRSGMSVAQALEAGMRQDNLRRDVSRKCIRVGG